MSKVVLAISPDDVVPVLQRPPTPKFSLDASYLVVGGMGGIGCSIVHWMVAHGARNLILMLRSAARNAKAVSFVDELRESGCRVKPVSCNVSSEDELAEALRSCKEDGLPPIRGVIQAAMVLQDTVLEQMTFANYQAVILPKVHGTWNLHKTFKDADLLDFFVILSSIVGGAGNASQANYSAAGSYQDTLARWRLSRGLPAVSIDLGAVKAIGVAAETAGAGHHWDSDSESQLGRDARFAALRTRHTRDSSGKVGADSAGDRGSLAGKLAAASSADEAIGYVGAAIAEKLSVIFMVPVADIDFTKRPSQCGIDSLVAVELRNMLVQQAGADVSIFSIMQSASLTALTADVAAKSAHLDATLFEK
ncbi:KR domain-containing protein [Thelonectria olida]|uniref:KR domain-containing protein n=1 Tax=Thelonectria olida TaxID=1576542 RepID=A0A9P9AIM1_9HYPO|nr:KR domain-containing protein [Thelonectria olida]